MGLHELSDEVLGLEARRDELKEAIHSATDELATAKKEHDERVKREAKVRRGRRLLVLGAIIGVVVVALGGFVLWYSNIDEVMLHGTITSASEGAPAVADARCRVNITQEYGPYNALIRIDCAGARLYGSTSGFGVLRCDTDGSRVVRCEDTGDIGYDGDPRLLIDRDEGVLRLDDGRRWQIEVALDEI